MDFATYQKKARETAIYPDIGRNIWYPTLGLAGEAGEVAEKVKKIFRDNRGKLDLSSQMAIRRELGDVLWYVANLAAEIGCTLDDVALDNLFKLADRANRDTLPGSGDNR